MPRPIHVAFAALAIGLVNPALADEADWKEVEKALGVSGSMQPGDVYRVSLPRTDLEVTVDGIKIDPALSLGTWVAFKPMEGGAMLMGDLVLTQKELTPVMTRLAEGGIEVTAVHHHLIRAEPMPLYMHIHGQGDPVEMAKTIRAAVEQSTTPLQAASGARPAKHTELDTEALDRIIGYKGDAAGGVYRYGIPRADEITQHGVKVPPSMGTANAIGFQPTGGGKAAINGDFVMTAEEVEPVLLALRENGIEVVALHNHMLEEEPRLFFMHFWANDDATKLARGLRAALDQIAIAAKG